MKPIGETPRKNHTDPLKVNENSSLKKDRENNDDEGNEATHVDLDKANFADRKHGRTTESLGPDHEPGTV